MALHWGCEGGVKIVYLDNEIRLPVLSLALSLFFLLSLLPTPELVSLSLFLSTEEEEDEVRVRQSGQSVISVSAIRDQLY